VTAWPRGPGEDSYEGLKVSAYIEVARDKALRSFRVGYEIRVDGTPVGRLNDRGQTLRLETSPGHHEVQAFFAASVAGSAVNERRTSAVISADVSDGETACMTVSLGAATYWYRAPGSTEDWLLLVPHYDDAESSPRSGPQTRVSGLRVLELLLGLVIVVAFTLGAFVPLSRPMQVTSQLVLAAAAIVLAVLLYRRFSTTPRA